MEKDFIVKIHKTYRWVLAVCDKEIQGQKFIKDKKQLDTSTRFFQGEQVNSQELKDIINKAIKEDATFYIIGNKSVDFFKKMKIISDHGIKNLCGVDYALVLL